MDLTAGINALGRETSPAPVKRIESRFLGHSVSSLVTITTELPRSSQIIFQCKCFQSSLRVLRNFYIFYLPTKHDSFQLAVVTAFAFLFLTPVQSHLVKVNLDSAADNTRVCSSSYVASGLYSGGSSSNLGQDTAYPDRDICDYPQSCRASVRAVP